jgi:hypothetical protein
MGINYDAKAIYGIILYFEDIEHLKEEWKDLAETIGTNNIINLWDEMGYIYTWPYFDASEEDTIYFIGCELSEGDDITELDNNWKQRIIRSIQYDCNELNIEYKEPSFYVRPHIW